MAWETGDFAQAGNTVVRYFFAFDPGDPGQEVIGVHPVTPDAELQWDDAGVVLNGNCSLTYFLTVRNVSANAATFRFRGAPI
jgi:hypothetical protein